MITGSRQRGKIWKFCQREVHTKGSGAGLPCFHSCGYSLRYRVTWQEALEQILWIDVRNHGARSNRRPILQDHTHGAVAFNDDFANLRADIDVNAIFGSDTRHGLRDLTHAADGVTPHA